MVRDPYAPDDPQRGERAAEESAAAGTVDGAAVTAEERAHRRHRHRHRGSRPSAPPVLRVAVGGLAVLALVAAIALVSNLRGSEFETVSENDQVAAPVRTSDPEAERLAGARDLLKRRADALRDHDRAAWLALIDPQAEEFTLRQQQAFDNAAAVPFQTVSMEYAGPGPELSAQRAAQVGPGAWVARVVVTYRLADADVADVRKDRSFTFVERDTGWYIADDTDGSSGLEVWDLGPVRVERGSRVLVVGTAEQDVLARIAGQVDEAAAAVDEVWGDQWPRTSVVLVPRDQAEMARLLNREDETGLDQIAAVTTGEVGNADGATADRVIVNPSGFGALRGVGADVVLTHELTHVAVRATGPGHLPLWVSEGFADYVAYAGRGLTRRQIAQDVVSAVSEGEGPTALPLDSEFDPSTHDQIATAYSASWLAVDLMKRRYGDDAPERVVRAMVGSYDPGAPPAQGLDAAMSSVLGVTTTQFEQEWLDDLDELAR